MKLIIVGRGRGPRGREGQGRVRGVRGGTPSGRQFPVDRAAVI